MLSRIIRLTTNDEFAHVSIALDQELKEMYSFGRLNPYNPFFGGFVHESPNYGTFKRFENTTRTNIYSLEVTDYQYKKLRRKIKAISKMKEKYRFNRLGLALAKFRFKFKQEERFYCAEFVKHVMDESDIETDLPEVVKPEDFKYLKNTKLDYSGMLKDYSKTLKGAKYE